MKNIQDKIINLDSWIGVKFHPTLVFCETRQEKELYEYYKKVVSSLPDNNVPSNTPMVRILVRDSKTQKYIGIMALCLDKYIPKKANDFLNWNADCKKLNAGYVYNLITCVPLQPFGYNTTGGKLLAMLAFSKEIYDHIYKKYTKGPLCIITTSINGKSIQYKDLDVLEYIGNTTGYGTVHIPDELYSEFKNYDIKWLKKKNKQTSKLVLVKRVLDDIKTNSQVLYHGSERGIYIGYTTTTRLDKPITIQIQSPTRNVLDITNDWYLKHAKKRIESLTRRGLISKDTRLYNKDYYTNNPPKVFKLPNYTKRITDDIIMGILEYKKTRMSYQEISTQASDQFNMYFSVNDISNIYNGNTSPTIQSQEYIDLMSLVKKRSNSNRLLTDNQILFVVGKLTQKYNYNDIKKSFNLVYNQNINDQMIYRIKQGKLVPK